MVADFLTKSEVKQKHEWYIKIMRLSEPFSKFYILQIDNYYFNVSFSHFSYDSSLCMMPVIRLQLTILFYYYYLLILFKSPKLLQT